MDHPTNVMCKHQPILWKQRLYAKFLGFPEQLAVGYVHVETLKGYSEYQNISVACINHLFTNGFHVIRFTDAWMEHHSIVVKSVPRLNSFIVDFLASAREQKLLKRSILFKRMI